MFTDPNWLYSTIAQSSAAIVAIIGGFITASVLSLSAEKRSLIDQQRDKGTRLELLKNEKAALSQELDVDESKNFITSVIPKIIDSGKHPSFEELITENSETHNLNLDILKKDYEIFTTTLLLANDFIEKNSNKITPKSGEFIELLGIFLGAWGIHRFYLGYVGIGIAQIIVTIVTFGFGAWWGFIEGILILTGTFNKDAKGFGLKGD